MQTENNYTASGAIQRVLGMDVITGEVAESLRSIQSQVETLETGLHRMAAHAESLKLERDALLVICQDNGLWLLAQTAKIA